MPGGRPTKYDPETMIPTVETMGHDGESVTAIAVELGIQKSTMYAWMEEHPEFSNAIESARARSQLWWEKIGRQQAAEGKGNSSTWMFTMKNRFREDYRDRTELDVDAQVGVFEIDYTGANHSGYHDDSEEG